MKAVVNITPTVIEAPEVWCTWCAAHPEKRASQDHSAISYCFIGGRDSGEATVSTIRDLVHIHEASILPMGSSRYVEIGGVHMTREQFDAARFPLLNPAPDLTPAELATVQRFGLDKDA